MTALYGDDEDWTPTTVAVVGLAVVGAAAAAFAGAAACAYGVVRFVGRVFARRVTSTVEAPR